MVASTADAAKSWFQDALKLESWTPAIRDRPVSPIAESSSSSNSIGRVNPVFQSDRSTEFTSSRPSMNACVDMARSLYLMPTDAAIELVPVAADTLIRHQSSVMAPATRGTQVPPTAVMDGDVALVVADGKLEALSDCSCRVKLVPMAKQWMTKYRYSSAATAPACTTVPVAPVPETEPTFSTRPRTAPTAGPPDFPDFRSSSNGRASSPSPNTW